ncbi:MAG: TonB-dependent receptor [Luteimonas sp.]
MKPVSLTPLAAALSIVLSLPIQTATATTDDAGAREPKDLDTIEVKGQRIRKTSSPKLTESVVDTPQTIVTIPHAVFTQQAQTSLRDVLRNTPGIAVQAGEGGSAPGDNIFVRGFGARNDVFIDGVRDPGVLSRDTFNIEAVEVAKGPASTISGRGSTGGAINLVTKVARSSDFGDFRITAGSDHYQRGSADINQTFGEGSALRLNAVWTDAGVPGRDEVRNHNWGVAPSLAFGLGSPNRLHLNLMHMQQDNLPDYGLPGTLPANLPPDQTIDDLDWSNFYGLKSRDHEDITSDQATIIIEHDLGDGAQLRNLSRYGRNVRDTVVTPPRAANAYASNGTTPQSLNDPGFDPTRPQIRRTDTKYQDRDDAIFANQTNLVLDFETGVMRHALVTGIEFSREESNSYVGADRCAPSDGSIPPADICPGGRPPVTDIYNPDPDAPYQAQIHRTGTSGHATADNLAVYAFDTLHLNERWELSAGLRRERFDVDYLAITAPAAPGTPNTTQRFNRRDDMTSWRAGLVYKPTQGSSLYAAYGTSFNPSADGTQGLVLAPGSTGGVGANDPSLAPEKNSAFEVGTKWNLHDDRLLLTAALFRSEKTKAKTTDAAGNIVLAGNQQVQGIELGVSGSLTENWALTGGFAWMDSSIEESAVAVEVDKALQYAPKSSFNLWSTYRVLPKLLRGGGAQFSDGYFFTNANTPDNPNLALIQAHTRYWLFNAMATYDIGERTTLQLNINNLVDERYVERGYTGHFTPGSGRSILMGVSYRF